MQFVPNLHLTPPKSFQIYAYFLVLFPVVWLKESSSLSKPIFMKK